MTQHWVCSVTGDDWQLYVYMPSLWIVVVCICRVSVGDWDTRAPLRRLQSFQNAAARLVSGTHLHDHITPVVASLHWLPVHQQVVFKMAVLVWKCLHGAAPHYLADLCVPVAWSEESRQLLRSAATGVLIIPHARTSIGQQSFGIRGPTT